MAKSGSGREGNIRGSVLPAGNGPRKAPDPSQVWNKNRRKAQTSCPDLHGIVADRYLAAQPPAPKHFTDEELKQQYGIHLATRLQADETGKEAKWADIDDDDDDWAPEIIEWNDGTKINLATLEEQTNLGRTKVSSPDTPREEEVEEEEEEERTVEKLTQSMLSQVAPAAVGGDSTKTSVTNGGQQKSAGLVLKGTSEKPTLVAKPLAPVPVKSPWQTLPPVDKIPPVTVKPQSSQSGERSQKDPHGFDSTPSVSSPAKEIAADDFNRSWRESQSAPNRELFNSHSGRYEPVNDNRRGSMRSEQHFRQPSVLQRPLQSDHKGPAEPSAAFQTSRSSGQEATWGRRRTSSSLSGGSGNLARRMSNSKIQDGQLQGEAFAGGRRGSHQAILPESPHSQSSQPQVVLQTDRNHPRSRPQALGPKSAEHVSDSGTTEEQLQEDSQHADSNISHGVQNALQPPAEDPIAMQKKIMRESRELAMKRRKEQEEKEEVERRERIRKKMETLGLPPPGQKSETPHVNAISGTSAKENKTAPVLTPKPVTRPTLSPPKPPVPELSGEVKQYGMMKVHHPESVRKQMSGRQQVPRPVINGNNANPPLLSPSATSDNSRQDNERSLTNGASPSPKVEVNKPVQREPKHDPAPTSGQQPWDKTAADSQGRHAWGGATMAPRSSQISQLWGAPGADRMLGNGAFTGDYPSLSNLPEIQKPHPLSTRDPGPIGPPTSTQQPSHDPSVVPKRDVLGSSIDGHHAPTSQNQANKRVNPDGRFDSRVGVGFVTSVDPGITSTSTPTGLTDQQRAISAWKSLPAQLEARETEAAAKAAREHAARLEEQARDGSKPDVHQPAFKETWRQVVMDDHSNGQRKVVGISKTVVGTGDQALTGPRDRSLQLPPGPGAPPHLMGIMPFHNSHGSRFFPHVAEAALPPHLRGIQNPMLVELEIHPPPDSADHPAYDGDVKHPLVSLPAPKPIVRLPPAVAQDPSPENPVVTKAADAGRSLPRQIDIASSWQDRIKGLFARKPSAATKSQTLPVSSASRAPLEVIGMDGSATVSLPNNGPALSTHPSNAATYVDETVTSRATDEALFEEREFGSLPTVKLPTRVPANAWQPARPPLTPRGRPRFQKSIHVLSIEPYFFKDVHTAQGVVIEVRLPGSAASKSVIKARSNINPRQRTPSSSNNHWKDRRRTNKPKETSASYSSPKPGQGGPSRANPASGSATGNASNAGNATWARRVSGTVR